MTAVEIALIVIGIICIIVSLIFNFGDSNQGEDALVSVELSETQKNRIEEQINAIVLKKMEDVKEETEASLDHVSNTKILEMNEYAENVLGEINRNHNETVFLYDMLNEKAKELKTTVKDVNNAKRQVEQIHVETAANEETPEEARNKRKHYAGSNSTRDIAKERLVALVKKSNERARGEDGSLRRNVQAEKLDHIVNASKDEPHIEPVMESTKSETQDKNGRKLPQQAEEKEDKSVKQEENKEKTDKSAKQKESKEKADKAAKQEEGKEKTDKSAKQEEGKEKTDKAAKQEEGKEKADKAAKQEESKEKADKAVKQEEGKEKADKAAKQGESKEKADKAAKQEESKEKADKAAKQEKDKEKKMETESGSSTEASEERAEKLSDSEKPAAKAKTTEKSKTAAKKKADEKENADQGTEKEVKTTTTRKRTVKKKASDAAPDGNGDHKAASVQFEKGATTNEKILKLYESGINNRDIAKMLNLGMGEVKLVIDLYKGGK